MLPERWARLGYEEIGFRLSDFGFNELSGVREYDRRSGGGISKSVTSCERAISTEVAGQVQLTGDLLRKSF